MRCSFCEESDPVCSEIYGTGLHACDGCAEELAAWAAAHIRATAEHTDAAFPWELGWESGVFGIGEVA